MATVENIRLALSVLRSQDEDVRESKPWQAACDITDAAISELAAAREEIERGKEAVRQLVEQQELGASAYRDELQGLKAVLEDRLAENERLREEVRRKDEALSRILELRMECDEGPCNCGECSQCLARAALSPKSTEEYFAAQDAAHEKHEAHLQRLRDQEIEDAMSTEGEG